MRVYFTAYARWIDDAIIEMFRERGITYDEMGGMLFKGSKLKETMVVGEYSCRIVKPSSYDDVLLLEVKIREMREKVIVFDGVFKDPKNGDVMAYGSMTYVCVNQSAMKSAPIPKEIREALSN